MRTSLLAALVSATLFVGCEPPLRSDSAAADETTQFDFAGVIEGFYGSPWSHQDRLDVIAFMGRTPLDTYVYAPKDDPYHLARWREPYPPDQLAQLGELVTHAAANAITFWYAISPGLSMRYSSVEDYQALLAKINSVGETGVRHFGLFLDDVPLRLEHESDRGQFRSLAEAQVSLVNRLREDLALRAATLMVTPTVYTSAWDDRDYVNYLGEHIHPEVLLVWTGPDVATDTITAAASTAWAERLGRRVVLWDNYPVNDFAPWRVFLGPVRGRDPELPNSTAGILANPMNQAHASLIALHTLGQYVADPRGYNPDAALETALDQLLGMDHGPATAILSGMFGDYAPDPNVLEPLYMLRDTIDLSGVARRLETFSGALDALAVGNATDPDFARKLVDELQPVLRRNTSRVQALRGDQRYRLEEGLLVYDAGIDTYTVPRSTREIRLDGELDDWASATWYPMRGRARADVAFAADEDLLYAAIRAGGADLVTFDGARIGEGTHVQLVIDHNESTERVSPDDLFVLIAPSPAPVETVAFVGSMRFEGFMAKWLADNESLTMTEFHLTTFGLPPSAGMADVARGLRSAAKRGDSGFTVEIALPRTVEHISLTVTVRDSSGRATSSLAARNYPANPATFVRLRPPI